MGRLGTTTTPIIQPSTPHPPISSTPFPIHPIQSTTPSRQRIQTTDSHTSRPPHAQPTPAHPMPSHNKTPDLPPRPRHKQTPSTLTPAPPTLPPAFHVLLYSDHDMRDVCGMGVGM